MQAACAAALGCLLAGAAAAAPGEGPGEGTREAPGEASATVAFSSDVRLRLADVDEARRFLGEPDAFTDALGEGDLLIRYGEADASYLDRAVAAALPWSDAEAAVLEEAIALTRARFGAHGVALPLPEEVLIIKATGAEEGNAGAYTRRNAVILDETPFAQGAEGLAGVLAHELFHVASRHAPEIRDELYGIIGFAPSPPLVYPASLERGRITDPDAFHFDHCIMVRREGAEFCATPILFLDTDADLAALNSLFEALVVRLLGVAPDGAAMTNDDGTPLLVSMDDVSGFYEQIGRNTRYTIHPEEIIATNFSLLVRDAPDLPNPEIPEQIQEALSAE
jgi:hypothetical protein